MPRIRVCALRGRCRQCKLCKNVQRGVVAGRRRQVVAICKVLYTRTIRPKESGRNRQVVAIYEWSLTQVLLYHNSPLANPELFLHVSSFEGAQRAVVFVHIFSLL